MQSVYHSTTFFFLVFCRDSHFSYWFYNYVNSKQTLRCKVYTALGKHAYARILEQEVSGRSRAVL